MRENNFSCNTPGTIGLITAFIRVSALWVLLQEQHLSGPHCAPWGLHINQNINQGYAFKVYIKVLECYHSLRNVINSFIQRELSIRLQEWRRPSLPFLKDTVTPASNKSANLWVDFRVHTVMQARLIQIEPRWKAIYTTAKWKNTRTFFCVKQSGAARYRKKLSLWDIVFLETFTRYTQCVICVQIHRHR